MRYALHTSHYKVSCRVMALPAGTSDKAIHHGHTSCCRSGMMPVPQLESIIHATEITISSFRQTRPDGQPITTFTG
jgi:hypothetical protein